ncbi:MAG: YhdP family protein [Dokdonella sp.]
MTSWRARLRRLRFALLAAGATVVILLGVLAALTQLAMPWLERNPQYVERWLSQRLDRPVKIARLSGAWVGGGPLLALENVQIGARNADQGMFSIPHAELAFDLYALFQRNRAVSEFRLSGVELKLVHEGDTWRLRDLDLGSSEKTNDPFSMGALGAVEISRLKLGIEDTEHNVHLALEVPVLRVLNHGAVTRVLGRVRLPDADDTPPLEFVADLDINSRSGQLYVGGRDVDLGRLAAGQAPAGIELAAGHGAIQLWAQINAAQVDDVRMRVDLHDAQFSGAAPVTIDASTAITPRVAFDHLAFVARWMRETGGWTFDVADLVADSNSTRVPARLTIERRGNEDNARYRAGAAALPLQPLGDFAMLAQPASEKLRRWLYLAHPQGTLASADLRWAGVDDYDVNASLRGVALASVDVVPGIDLLDLDLHGDEQSVLAQLPQQALRVDYPRVFRKPFLLNQFGGDVVARRIDEGWRVETDRLGFEGVGYGGELRGGLNLIADRKPSVDMYVALSHADVVSAKLFWPTTSMSAKAINWLDRALVGGRVVDGRVALIGDLANWPFHDDSGRMIARAELVDTTLDYDSSWPRAEKLHAIATFINDSVQLDADSAEAMGNHISEVHGVIPDFGPLVLDLAVKGEGSGANLLGFLRATPIGKRRQEQLKDIAISGKGNVAFTLNLPIKQIESLNLDGGIDLVGAKLDHNTYDLHFIDANGHLRFNQKGFSADALDVQFREHKAKLSIAIGNYVADAKHAFEAGLIGRFPATTVFADVPVLLPALVKFPGESEWSANVSVDDSSDAGSHSRLIVSSDLRGTAIDLPAPLAKSADEARPFRLGLDLPYAGQSFEATLGQLVAVNGRLPGAGRAFAGRVQFGAQKPLDPPAQGVVVGGRMPQLDVGAWIDLIERDAGGTTGGVVQEIDVRADDFVFADRHFDDMHMVVGGDSRVTTIQLDGAAIAGKLEIPKSDASGRGVDARFERIHWPEAPAETADSESSAFANIAPGSLPALRINVDDFQLGKASFGSAEFRSHPIANGMQVDALNSQSPNVSMKASGDWTGNARENSSRMAIELTAQNLGHMMDALGFPGLIDGGSTRATIDAAWLGPPSAFALPKLDGTLSIDVAEGRILDVEPGAGRIFGLFSLGEIRRRLSLDFSDFFQKGLSFNSIVGSFRLGGGNAYTDDLKIKSPAADIVVTGRTGLRAKDYDQLMVVNPHAGATLPIVGALAAGPVGAAAGLVMQGILNKPLGKAVGSRYQVTGSWDKPKILLLAREKTTVSRKKKKADVEDPAALPDETLPPPATPASATGHGS